MDDWRIDRIILADDIVEVTLLAKVGMAMADLTIRSALGDCDQALLLEAFNESRVVVVTSDSKSAALWVDGKKILEENASGVMR